MYDSAWHSRAGNLALRRTWQTADATGEAWLELQPSPPTAFNKLELVNAGSALVEVQGWKVEAGRAVADRNGVMEYNSEDGEILLPNQQVMSQKDIAMHANRNREYVYEVGKKLTPLALRHRYGHILPIWLLINTRTGPLVWT